MRRNYLRLLALLCILCLSALTGCGSSDIYPIERPATAEPAETPCVDIPEGACDQASAMHEEAPAAEKETLPEEDRDKPVEENINAEDIEQDVQITEDAAEEDVTQDEVGTSPEECETCANGAQTYPVLKIYSTTLPEGIVKDLKYTGYEIAYDYVLILYGDVNVRRAPTTQSEIIKSGVYGEKYSLVATVEGEYLTGYESNRWHEITFKDGEDVATGYIFAPLTAVRCFQFDKMYRQLTGTQAQTDGNITAYISNYKNYSGNPPLHNGSTVDDFGTRRYQSGVGYVEPDKDSYFRYIPDGMLLTVLDETDRFYKVKPLSFDGEYWVEKKYVSFENSIEQLSQVVVVDRKYQNCAVFEYRDGTWVMVSYVFVTTGMQGQYSLPTPLGQYMVIQKRDRFLYYKDGTKEVAGYAPYAIRFSGGGYLHGVPIQYLVQNGKKVDPGLQEYLHTIGTTPRSHMCVRNYTSHAKFMYDWLQIGSSAVIVIE